MTEQEINQGIFDTVYRGLLAQKFASEKYVSNEYTNTTRSVCAFRGSDGRKCAIGWLIPDDRYKPELEGNLAICPEVIEAMGLPIPETVYVNSPILLAYTLQRLHDNFFPRDSHKGDEYTARLEIWKNEMKTLARRSGLTVPTDESMGEAP